jgi:hypothetical protein
MDCVIGGISARRAGDKSLQLPEIVRAGATALFCRCHFDRGSFAGCAFADVGFEKCEVRHTQFINCDFRNVVGPDRWWTQVESGDPFNSFLDTVLNGIEERLGRDSSAFLSLSGFAKEYRLGRTQDKDYSACLYTGDVPEEELDAIQEILDQAESAFPM